MRNADSDTGWNTHRNIRVLETESIFQIISSSIFGRKSGDKDCCDEKMRQNLIAVDVGHDLRVCFRSQRMMVVAIQERENDR